ncbi:MAG: transcriptional regulator [Candidatus Sericytochromatia bacterium]|nr:MAG: transcriptional regulator [Candidatus Sericytochromatia bacterium]
MNKEQLVSAIAKEAGMTKKDVALALDATLKCVTEALKNQDKVTLVGFGTFQVKERAARDGRNPKTGEVIKIPAKKVPVFSAGKGLRDAVSPATPAKKKATSKKK